MQRLGLGHLKYVPHLPFGVPPAVNGHALLGLIDELLLDLVVQVSLEAKQADTICSHLAELHLLEQLDELSACLGAMMVLVVQLLRTMLLKRAPLSQSA